MLLAVDFKLNYGAKVILVIGVTADKPDQFVIFVDMLLKTGSLSGTA
jgi:hypothetical protein